MVKFRAKLVILWVIFLGAVPAIAQEDDAVRLDDLLAQLANPATENWEQLENQVIDQWSRSGSRSADFLLQRGRDALEDEDYKAALEHFTALTDHAPDFAEGWSMRATVFFQMDELGLAIEDIGRALALNPQHFGALNGLGVILEQLDKNKAALAAYRAAYAINPHRENLSEAIERLEKSVDGVNI